ncbi:MAG: hypothetical protein HDQ99_04690 [Lachnospiraceae bacterium]|nr:hypothetical protein [Lachnospiraceae bacterium]
MLNWRAAYAEENSVILEWGKKAYKTKLEVIFILGALWSCMILLLSVLFSKIDASGKTWNLDWLIFGCMIIFIIIIICGMLILLNNKKLKMLEQRKYSVSEAQVIDKRTFFYRTTGIHRYLKVRFSDGSTEEYSVGTDAYSLEVKLIVIKYNDGMYGFYDRYDFVPIKE